MKRIHYVVLVSAEMNFMSVIKVMECLLTSLS